MLRALGGRLPTWARRPDGLFVLAVAAVLRLALLRETSFLGDQAELLGLARLALEHHALPATGIRFSIGTLSPPVAVYPLLPFALLSDPFWGTLATALVNLAAVALLYAIADRHSGRLAAFTAGILFATSFWPVWFSRFIWQPNLVVPVVLFFFWTACRGAIERRSGWLGWNLLLWGMAVQLHPSAAPLLALTVLALALSWRDVRPRLRPLPLALLVALFLPTLAWELASHGADIAAFRQYLGMRSVLDDAAVRTLRSVLTPADALTFGAGTAYASAVHAYHWVGRVIIPLYCLSVGWLVAALAAHALRWRRIASPLAPLLASGTNARYLALLALWQVAPLLPLLKHSTPIHEHYLLVIVPACFLTLGGFLAWLAARLATLLAAVQLPSAGAWNALAPGALVFAVLLMAAGQSVAVAAQLVTVHSGAFDDGARGQMPLHYGLPLANQQAALAAAAGVAHSRGARLHVATSALDEESFGYLAVAGTVQASVYDGSSCLLAPARGSTPAVTLATSTVAAGTVAAELRGATLLQTLSRAGDDPLRLYALPPGASLPGETPVAASGPHTASQPAAYAFDTAPDGTRRLLLRWSGPPMDAAGGGDAVTYWYGAQPRGPRLASYTFFAQPLDAAGQPRGAALSTTCPALSWGAGDDVITWLSLPAAAAGAESPAGWHVWGTRAPASVARPRLGPLALETGDISFGPSAALPGAATFKAPPP